MKKPSLRIKFTGFWSGWNCTSNRFTNLLSDRYDVQVCDDPDFLIYSCFSKEYLDYRCTRIFYTAENRRPDFRFCDFALTFDHLDHPNHYRLPNFATNKHYPSLVKPAPMTQAETERILAAKSGFCNFVYSNSRCRKRNRFFEKLSKYKRVDSGGRWLNNIGKPVVDKVQFLRQYKFTIAFENSSYPGYSTEKILHPMVADSLPIYWGNRLVHLDFDPRSFLNYFDYGSDETLIERIIELDRNDKLYLEYVKQPWLHNNEPDRRFSREALLAYFDLIFNLRKTPVAVARRNVHYWDLVVSRLTCNAGRLVDNVGRLMRSE